jgi:hypothetical protein
MFETRADSPPFGGVAGRIVKAALSVETLLMGLALVGMSAFFVWGSVLARADQIGPAVVQILFAVALGRYAVQGLRGDTGSGVEVAEPGEWGRAFQVAMRYLFLCCLWLVPLLALGLKPSALGQAWVEFLFTQGGTRVLSLAAIYVVASMLTPPAFLIVAAGADRFFDVLSPSHWRRLFAGRFGDLFLVYALCLGGVLMVFLLASPVLIATVFQSPKTGLFFAGVSAVFGMGYLAVVLGRLCGMYARGGVEQEEAEPEHWSETRPALPRSGVGSSGSHHVAAPPVATSIAPAGPSGFAAMPVHAQTRPRAVEPAPDRAASWSAGDSGIRAAGDSGIHAVGGRTPLLDARARVDQILERSTTDTAGAIRALEELRATYAPHPMVLWGLCVVQARAGQFEAASALAHEMIPTLIDRGNLRPAAEIYKELGKHAEQLDVRFDHLVAIAEELVTMEQTETATEAFFRLLRTDPLDKRSIKRMLQIAEDHLQGSRAPEEALRIYRFLLDYCGGSPLAEYMHLGLAEAERLLEARHRRSA